MKLNHTELKKTDDVPEASIFAVVGAEDFARQTAITIITTKFLDPDFSEFDCDKIDGGGLDAAQALAAWQTVPLGSPRRVVTIRNLDEAQPAEIGKLAKAATSTCSRGCLILDISSDASKEVKALIKAVSEVGVVVSCSAARQEDARAFLAQATERLGVKYEPLALEELIRRLGPDLWQLVKESEKLANYIWPQTIIKKSDVEALITAAPEDRIFAMIDAMSEGRPAAAGQMLDSLFRAADDIRAAAHRTLAVLVRHFRLLWQARVLRDAGFTFRDVVSVPASAAVMLPAVPNILDVFKRQTFLMGKYRAQSERFDLKTLADAFDILADTDLALKGQKTSVGSPQADLEICLTRLGLLSGTRKRPKTP